MSLSNIRLLSVYSFKKMFNPSRDPFTRYLCSNLGGMTVDAVPAQVLRRVRTYSWAF